MCSWMTVLRDVLFEQFLRELSYALAHYEEAVKRFREAGESALGSDVFRSCFEGFLEEPLEKLRRFEAEMRDFADELEQQLSLDELEKKLAEAVEKAVEHIKQTHGGNAEKAYAELRRFVEEDVRRAMERVLSIRNTLVGLPFIWHRVDEVVHRVSRAIPQA